MLVPTLTKKGQGEGRRKTEAHLAGSRREVGEGHEGGLLLTSYLLEYSDDWQTERCYMNAGSIKLQKEVLFDAA